MSSLFTEAKPIVGYARIAVERGVDRYPDGLTYAIPAGIDDLVRGDRVLVPLGRGDTPTAGCVIDLMSAADLPASFDPDRVKTILQRDRIALRLPAQLIELARWISSYYCTPIGITLASMLPASVKRGVGLRRCAMIDLGEPLSLDEKLPPKQRQVLEALAAIDPDQRPVELRDLADRAGLRTKGPIQRLLEKGLLEQRFATTIEAEWRQRAGSDNGPHELTGPQQRIVDELRPRLGDGFSTHLLYGVTGSGKTEVYLHLIDEVMRRGRVALVLVPEIALTPQTGGRLMARFPSRRVAVLHSGLTSAQRHQQWALVASGEADLVIGARSAVFAPIPQRRLGLLVVDEEHDSSYKQDQAPRYHGRDVAIRLGQIEHCPVLLGSATPSLESWYNATTRRVYELHRLTERVPGARLPQVQIVDFRAQQKQRQDRRGVHLLGPLLEEAIGQTLFAGRQVLLLLNRRGYANYIACPDHHCGWLMCCDDCDATMVYHRARALPTGGFVQCHYCRAEQKLPATCPDCQRKITTFGLGTQRVEEELARKFSMLVEGEAMLRVDSDTMHRAVDYHSALERFGSGEIRLMVGTQMIAKGLDYPGVRLVGVINADTTINLPDFRATERTFQLVSQVAGRCGRGIEPGRVIVQSFRPEVPALQLAATHDYETFARQQLLERADFAQPPITRMARIVIRDEDQTKCLAAARVLTEALAGLTADGINLYGPAPCPISRIAGRFRQYVDVVAPSAALLQGLLTEARTRGLLRSGAAMAIDVDPLALL